MIFKNDTNKAHSHYSHNNFSTPLTIKENIPYASDHLNAHKLDVIYPRIKTSSYPFIINVHGGAFALHSKNNMYREYAIRLASNRFAVVNINYRLTPKNIYPAQVEDVLAVIKFVENNAHKLRLDCSNMFLNGDSAGGYLCTMAAAVMHNEELKAHYNFSTNVECRAIATNGGMFDFTTFMGNDVIFPMKRKITEMLFGQHDYQNAPQYPFSSVLKYINPSYPPVYITDTENISFANEALRFEKVLKEQGVDYRIHIFKKDNLLRHDFNVRMRYPQGTLVLTETFNFFKSNMKVAPIIIT